MGKTDAMSVVMTSKESANLTRNRWRVNATLDALGGFSLNDSRMTRPTKVRFQKSDTVESRVSESGIPPAETFVGGVMIDGEKPRAQVVPSAFLNICIHRALAFFPQPADGQTMNTRQQPAVAPLGRGDCQF